MKKITSLISFAVIAFMSCKHVDNAPSGDMQNNSTDATTEPQMMYRHAVAETPENKQTDASSSVWVCKSAGSRKYHLNPDCGGLGRCKHKIEKMTMADAETVGLTRCSYKKCN